MGFRLRVLQIATACLYLGPLLAGLGGYGWRVVPVFAAIFLLWLIALRPQEWPQSRADWMQPDTWMAMVTPRGLPADVKARVDKALADVEATPAVRDQLAAKGYEHTWAKRKAVEELINAELPKMRATAQRAGIKPE